MNREDIEGELEKLHPTSYAWALGCCRRDREEAEDVLQDTYLKILDRRARFAGGSSFKTFLFGVIRRTAAEHRRRSWLQRVRLASWSRSVAEMPESPAGAEAHSFGESDLQPDGLPAALAKLATRQREVLELVFGHELTIEEAARTLGISLGSARVHYERGKQRLRRALGEETAMSRSGDDDLRERFAVARRVDEQGAPPFRRTLERAVARRLTEPRWIRRSLAAAVVAIVVVVAARSLHRPLPVSAGRIETWRPPTDFLREISFPQLFDTVPTLSRAVPDYSLLLAKEKGRKS